MNYSRLIIPPQPTSGLDTVTIWEQVVSSPSA